MAEPSTNDPVGTRGITKIDPISIPGFGPSIKADEFDASKFRVKYLKIDFDDLGSISELQTLETRAIRNEGIYVLTKEKFTFNDRYFLVISYLEQEISAATLGEKKSRIGAY